MNDVYRFFAELIYKKSGIDYPEKDFYRLEGRLNQLKDHFECENLSDLRALFSMAPTKQMLEKLIELATNNETFFFRDQKPFDLLSNVIVKEYLERGDGRPLRLWSCACSTGQEPASIVMHLSEKHPEVLGKLSLLATDISDRVLKKCRSGLYSSLEVQRGLPITLLTKYFEQTEDAWQLQKTLLHKIDYQHHNLFSDSFPSGVYDAIFCRNVLIYQNTENKRIIIGNLMKALRPGGVLVLGSGESMIGMNSSFSQETSGGAIYFRSPEEKRKAS